MKNKYCPKCRVTKEISCFNIATKQKTGFQLWCKKCSARNRKKNYRINGYNKKVARSAMLKKQYGITNDIYEKMFSEQKGVCAICLLPETQISNKKYGTVDALRVDHNHKTGQVRGLLCSKCNFAVGHLKDNFVTGLALAIYLFNNQLAQSEVE